MADGPLVLGRNARRVMSEALSASAAVALTGRFGSEPDIAVATHFVGRLCERSANSPTQNLRKIRFRGVSRRPASASLNARMNSLRSPI